MFSNTMAYYSCFNTRQILSRKAHVNGVDIHYEKTGFGKHVVLLLPGALGEYMVTDTDVESKKKVWGVAFCSDR